MRWDGSMCIDWCRKATNGQWVNDGRCGGKYAGEKGSLCLVVVSFRCGKRDIVSQTIVLNRSRTKTGGEMESSAGWEQEYQGRLLDVINSVSYSHPAGTKDAAEFLFASFADLHGATLPSRLWNGPILTLTTTEANTAEQRMLDARSVVTAKEHNAAGTFTWM